MNRVTKIEQTKAGTNKRKIRVAAYCRVSTSQDDQLISLAAQRSHYETYIRQNPDWEYVGVYYDEGLTGTKKENRPALLRLMQDAEHGLIDLIITKSISRFSRNTTDCLELIRRLKELHVAIFFEKENINTGSMENEVVLSIMSSLAESESFSLAENEKWSKRNKFRNGSYKFSAPPYGYDCVDGELRVNLKEAAVVKRIYAEFLSGKGSSTIAKELEEEHVPTQRQGQWSATMIRNMLRNEKYTGDALFQKTYTDAQFHTHQNHGELDQYYVEDHHEALVSHEDFEKAQALIDLHAEEKSVMRETQKYRKRYVFSGKIICGECGSTMRRVIRHPNAKDTCIAWTCKTHIKDRTECKMKSIKEKAIQDAFVLMMNKLVFGRHQILEPLLPAVQQLRQTDLLQQLDDMDEQLQGLAEQRRTLEILFARSLLDLPVYTQSKCDLLSEEQRLEEKKKRITFLMKDHVMELHALKDLLRFVNRGKMLTAFDPELFETHVGHVTVLSTEEVEFCLCCGLRLKERMK